MSSSEISSSSERSSCEMPFSEMPSSGLSTRKTSIITFELNELFDEERQAELAKDLQFAGEFQLELVRNAAASYLHVGRICIEKRLEKNTHRNITSTRRIIRQACQMISTVIGDLAEATAIIAVVAEELPSGTAILDEANVEDEEKTNAVLAIHSAMVVLLGHLVTAVDAEFARRAEALVEEFHQIFLVPKETAASAPKEAVATTEEILKDSIATGVVSLSAGKIKTKVNRRQGKASSVGKRGQGIRKR